MQLSEDDPLDTSSRKAANVPSNFMGLLLLLTLTLEAKESYMIKKKKKLHDLTNDIVTPWGCAVHKYSLELSLVSS